MATLPSPSDVQGTQEKHNSVSPLKPDLADHSTQPASAVLELLGTDSEQGLAQSEVDKRLEQHGPNRLETHGRTHWFRVLVRQFNDALILILAIAAGVSFSVGEVLDGVAILAILLLNGLLAFIQEWRAERAIDALQEILSPRCRVRRNGIDANVEAATLVPGDIVLLSSGDRVPADLRLIAVQELELDEASLTGESLAVSKCTEPVAPKCPLAERKSMAWTGTLVTNGRGRGVVVATGMTTEFGRIAAMAQSVERDPTPLQRRLARLGKQLGGLAVVVSTLVALAGWWLGKPALEMFMTGVSLAVAVVPEGLPAVVTITLALGVRQMVKRRALPRRLQATETLGSATVLMTDKTGTLTESEMTVTHLWLPAGQVEVTGTGYTPVGTFQVDGQAIEPESRHDVRALLEAGSLCNNAALEVKDGVTKRVGEPTEAALLVVARKAAIQESKTPHSAEFTFDSKRKRMTRVFESDGERVAYAKGAPEVIFDRCTRVLDGETEKSFTQAERELAQSAYVALARKGMRTLALARRHLPAELELHEDEVEREFTLLGVVGIIDPPRPEVPDAVARAIASGIRVMMITGDSPETAQAIAELVGMPVKRVITGTELDELDDVRLTAELEGNVLFARATPEHKLRVARLLEDAGEVVGMTGDGVNDAPALKEAAIGIAMGIRGTDVAREASDLVLLDDNFATIVGAVEEGRREYDNIRKFVRYLLSSNIGETVAILLMILLRGPLILLPVQILWINVVTDALTAVALGLEPAEADLMRRPPRKLGEPILDRHGIFSVLALGGYIGLATLGLFLYILDGNPAENLLLAQTVAFTAMVVLEQVNLFNHRALRNPLVTIGLFSNPWLLVALAGTVLLQLGAVYLPFMQDVLSTTALGWNEWGLMLLAGLPLFLIPEAIKVHLGRKRRRAEHGIATERG